MTRRTRATKATDRRNATSPQVPNFDDSLIATTVERLQLQQSLVFCVVQGGARGELSRLERLYIVESIKTVSELHINPSHLRELYRNCGIDVELQAGEPASPRRLGDLA